jgi:hypothetical protein
VQNVNALRAAERSAARLVPFDRAHPIDNPNQTWIKEQK